MIRSKFAFTRLIVLPYSALLLLYLVVVGGGGVWLYARAHAVETRLLINNMMNALEPLAKNLRGVDALTAMSENTPWLVSMVRQLYADLPALRNVSVRDSEHGYQMEPNAAGIITSRATSPLPAGARRNGKEFPPSQRLKDETEAVFLLSFDISRGPESLIRLDIAFDRKTLLQNVNDGLVTIKQSIILFMLVGLISIVIAVFITAIAMRTTRRLESHFQGIYQRASLTETAAQLVHELRNHLAALRANTKALLVSPQETQEIVVDMDRDIVSLNDKLSAFLDLTRQHDEAFAPVDVGELINEAARLAEPVLHKHGLGVEILMPPVLPQPVWQKAAMRDALLNLIINAGQSGQQEGVVRVAVDMTDGMFQISVEDRGKGIDKRHLPHVFEAFYTTRDDGNGLGLAIVRRIVLAHRGRVYAENRAGGGTRFVLTMPVQRKETPRWWNKFKKHSPI